MPQLFFSEIFFIFLWNYWKLKTCRISSKFTKMFFKPNFLTDSFQIKHPTLLHYYVLYSVNGLWKFWFFLFKFHVIIGHWKVSILWEIANFWCLGSKVLYQFNSNFCMLICLVCRCLLPKAILTNFILKILCNHIFNFLIEDILFNSQTECKYSYLIRLTIWNTVLV